MTGRAIEIAGRQVWVAEAGEGRPLLYLHGFCDVHGAVPGFLPFHDALAEGRRLIAPAHPGCADSAENDDIDTVDDVAFHYLELLDALALDEVDVVGTCIGGWIAAELAVRHRERIARLALVGATGLFVPGRPIGDLFWQLQPLDGGTYPGLRHMLFADGGSEIARTFYPDARQDTDTEVLRYKTCRFASRIGFRPPYLHDRRLRGRLRRFDRPALAVWGEDDHMVPVDHGRAYAEGFARGRLELVQGAGHVVHVEAPAETARFVRAFLG